MCFPDLQGSNAVMLLSQQTSSPPLSLLFFKQFFPSKSLFPTETVFLPLSSAFLLE